MISDFKFWHFFSRQGQLIHNIQTTEMRNVNKRIACIIAIGLLVFAIGEVWGMNTSSLTPLLSAGMWDAYTLARWTSLMGTLLWAGFYVAFHLYGASFLFSKILKMPWRGAIIMQMYVTALLVIEKGLIFLLFAVTGFTTSVSFFSFGPIAATFLDNHFLIYFFNQLTVFTSLIIAVQYRFIRSFTKISPKLILFGLIMLHIFVALFVALFSLVPVNDMLSGFMEGGNPFE
ncbi:MULTISPECIES: hypothetical protein [Planococcus]|uniref:Uncharacterized protein n=1 Tax=Planococcus faecalis TaxID=1598147 RepID=A0ABM6IUQ0_9BACL|nr:MULTISPECIES: hypothetical protein [Planococcus]AQU80280.1 hypothetical protein AJGP001_13790 [Planococcus faecalis]MDJ0330429.1 hypothetical protein [Planococcus sp. S3-L1]